MVNIFWVNLLKSLRRDLEAFGFSLDFILTREAFDDQALVAKAFSPPPEGLIWINAFHGPFQREDSLLFHKLQEWTPHHVGIVCRCDELDNIRFEKARAMELVVLHLKERGKRSLAYIGDPGTEGTMESSGRYQGFRRALRELGLPFDQRMVLNACWEQNDSYQLTRELLSREPGLDAIVCMDDAKAFKVFRAIYEHGLRIPEDIAVTGYNNLPFSSFLSPALTTVDVPLDSIAAAAVSTLVSRINGDSLPVKNVDFRTTLVARSST